MVQQSQRKLILVRHSMPEMVPDLPASQWHLSDEGRLRCRRLAERLADHDLGLIVASQEPKAVETGQIVASILELPFETAPDLHEHERRNVGLLGSREEFQARVASVLERPGELVFGNETGDQAYRRFASAIGRLLAQHPGGNLAVVAHGTVMALFVGRTARLDPIPFWKQLGLPAFVVLSLPDFRLLEIVENVVG